MRLKWEGQTIQWFLDAGAYTGFHRKLAQRIIPYLKPEDSLCDAGCGIGRLDLELAPYVSGITAVDINENAIDVLRRDAAALGLHNLRAEIRDAEDLTEPFDVVLLSFFGQSNMFEFMKLCRRRLIRIVDACNVSKLYPERYKEYMKDTVPVVAGQLEAKGISYKLESAALEFGQPLRSLQDAEAYVVNNAPEAGSSEVSEFLSENLAQTGRDDFPFYLPNKKELGIFIIDKHSCNQ